MTGMMKVPPESRHNLNLVQSASQKCRLTGHWRDREKYWRVIRNEEKVLDVRRSRKKEEEEYDIYAVSGEITRATIGDASASSGRGHFEHPVWTVGRPKQVAGWARQCPSDQRTTIWWVWHCRGRTGRLMGSCLEWIWTTGPSRSFLGS